MSVVATRWLAAFVVLASFVALDWVGMVAEAPLARTTLSVVPVVATAALLMLLPLRSSRLPDWALNLIGALALLGATTLGMVIIGLPARLLLPAGWSELWSGVDLGLAGIGEGLDYPYDGPNEWSRLLALIAAPLIVGLAALLTFLPLRRDAGSPRLGGLAVLLIAYGTAATIHGSDLAVLRGVALLLAIVAWLWLPAIERRGLTAVTALLAVGLIAAVAFTARFSDVEAVVNYNAWTWAAGPGTSFDWEHSYGPIDWERTEETMMIVESKDPNYWKLSVLDRFDGRGWERSDLVVPPIELPSAVEPGASSELVADWRTNVSVTIDGLRSVEIAGPGTARRVVDGVEASPSADGTILRGPEPLQKGDAYRIAGYAPDPSEERMRAAGWFVPARLEPMTSIAVPELAGGPIKEVVTRGLREGRADDAVQVIEASPYARMARLAERLTAAAPTAYDAVKTIEAYLLDNYSYSETPPDRGVPLESFLFEDRVGYCQQFSGAMALMLRMRGIPARVATGFSPGVADGRDRFRVRAIDAHSWVEVYFSGLGWVPFDPTPAAAPAELRTGGSAAASSAASSLGPLLLGANAFLGDGTDIGGGGGGPAGPPSSTPAPASPSSGFSSNVGAVLAGLLATAAGLAFGPGLWRRFRERGLGPEEAVDARVRELDLALRRLRRLHDPDATLLELEHALRSHSEPLASRYVEGLRRRRYGRDPGTAPPNARQRRALRRRLTSGGLGSWIAGYRAIPPLSPRR